MMLIAAAYFPWLLTQEPSVVQGCKPASVTARLALGLLLREHPVTSAVVQAPKAWLAVALSTCPNLFGRGLTH